MNAKLMQRLGMGLLGLGAALAMHVSQSQTALTSLRLSDTIRQGSGTIDLLKAADGMNAATLEALRSDNNGRLVFAVDINENASGLETAKSQGVAVASVSLVVTFAGGSQQTFTQFSTETKALVAPQGSTTRTSHYTLLGDSGSSRISSNSKIGNAYFDSTLKVPVSANLGNATAAVLQVRLLNTTPTLGDPENFYDYSGGFEDMAILTQAKAQYFDEVLPIPQESTFRSEAPAVELSPEGQVTQSTLLAVATASTTPTSTQIAMASTPLSWVLMPGAGSFHTVAYEDRYNDPTLPAGVQSDYDFNDAVVAYRYQLGVNASGLVERISGEAYLIARGSNYTHQWSLEIALPATATLSSSATGCTTLSAAAQPISNGCSVALVNSGSATRLRWQAFADTRNILPVTSNSRPQRNTFADVTPVQGPKASFSVVFDVPVSLASVGADTPLLFVVDTQRTIGLDVRDARGFPYALKLPSNWQIPTEGTDMGLAYPAFADYVLSSGARSGNWYALPSSARVIAWNPLNWAW